MSLSAMGSSPDPRGPDATVADLAAAAVLGAVLWDPRRLREVMDWLEPDDFLHPVHRAIYATVTGLVAAGEPVDLMRLPAVLASGCFHEVHVNPREPGPLGAAALHTFLSFTPATPPRGGRFDGQPRSEHVRYAQLVLEASVRRAVHDAGVHIAQHAREAIDVVDASPTPPVYATVAAAVARLRPVLATIERHLTHLADRLDHPQGTPAEPPPRATGSPGSATTTLGAGRAPAQQPGAGTGARTPDLEQMAGTTWARPPIAWKAASPCSTGSGLPFFMAVTPAGPSTAAWYSRPEWTPTAAYRSG
jgi:DnaB helicase-like protein